MTAAQLRQRHHLIVLRTAVTYVFELSSSMTWEKQNALLFARELTVTTSPQRCNGLSFKLTLTVVMGHCMHCDRQNQRKNLELVSQAFIVVTRYINDASHPHTSSPTFAFDSELASGLVSYLECPSDSLVTGDDRVFF